MRSEIRSITIDKEIFIADDGTEFNTEWDCEKHDAILIENSLKFYNGLFEESDLDSCTYVHLRSAEDVSKLIRLCDFDEITTDGLDDVGVYVYDQHKNRWINMSESIRKIEAMQ